MLEMSSSKLTIAFSQRVMLLVIAPSPRTGIKSSATDVATVSLNFYDHGYCEDLTNDV
jgi:hypothetical protein